MCNIIFVEWAMRGEKEKKVRKREREKAKKKHYCNLNITTKLLLLVDIIVNTYYILACIKTKERSKRR